MITIEDLKKNRLETSRLIGLDLGLKELVYLFVMKNNL